ncbi:MAG: GNAT family N-acetyltransferase [Acidobacteria bacterium]|nr:GNAT family N-acetyltransferase [Acidobacteriota bacterium]
MIVEPVTLEGAHVRLEPLSLEHQAGLCEVGLDKDLWRWIPHPVTTPAEMRAYIETALEGEARGSFLPFATIEKSSGRVIGSTRYGNIDRENNRLEIGWTWVARPWQRTAVNTEAKYLMLRHAFETLGCMRVEFKTDSLNERSRNAILRLGATEEGIFRNHMLTSTGRIRHTVYFSIIDSEWLTVKAGLEGKLARSTNQI